jgi:hypothetical protein
MSNGSVHGVCILDVVLWTYSPLPWPSSCRSSTMAAKELNVSPRCSSQRSMRMQVAWMALGALLSL